MVVVYVYHYFFISYSFALFPFAAEAKLGKPTTPEKKQKISSTKSKDVSFDRTKEDFDDEDKETINLHSPRSADTYYTGEECEDNDSLPSPTFQVRQQPMQRDTSITNLTHQMKSTNLSSRPIKPPPSMVTKYLAVKHPSTIWSNKDANKRQLLCNILIHLPSATIQEDLKLSLETRSRGRQFLIIKERMSQDFLHPALFLALLPDSISEKDKNLIEAGRVDELSSMQGIFTGDLDDEDGEIWMRSEYELPFLCDDLFETPEDERYPGTYCELLEWTLGDNNDANGGIGGIEVANQEGDGDNTLTTYDIDGHGNLDKCKIFFIRLVAQDKVKERATKSTPTRKIVNQVIARRARRI